MGKPLLILIAVCFLLFLPGFRNYFHEDDFIDLALSQNFQQVVNSFNIFSPYPDFPFYRPIPTQLYFFITRSLFGLEPLGYHFLNFALFCLVVVSVYTLIKKITVNELAAFFGSIIFALNSTHFAGLNAPSYAHEFFLVLFACLTTIFFLDYLEKKRIPMFLASLAAFVLALMSKETAVVLPVLLGITGLFLKKEKLSDLLKLSVPFLGVTLIYLFGHFVYYGLPQSESYKLILGKSNLTVLVWYFFWALSSPNIMTDFIGPGLKINPVFFQVSQTSGKLYLVSFPIFLAVFGYFILRVIKTRPAVFSYLIFGFLWFVVGVLPVVVFPLHRLAIEQSLSLVGLSIVFGKLLSDGFFAGKKLRLLALLCLGLYCLVAVNSIILARSTHWIPRMAGQAKSVVSYFSANYPDLPDDSVVYFVDGEIKIPAYGSSKQLALALAGNRGLRLALGKPNLQVYYQAEGELPTGHFQPIVIDASRFLGY